MSNMTEFYTTKKGRLCKFFPQHLRPESLDREKLPNPKAFDYCCQDWFQDLAWNGKPWLYAFGRTGRGKTRMLSQILFCDVETEIEVWTASELKMKFASLCRDYNKLEEFKSSLIYCEMLAIDDFGHTLSESFAENLRVVLEKRGNEGPIIFTSQYSPDAFMTKCEKEKEYEQAQAIMRRILDWAEVVDFGGITKPMKGKRQ